MSTLGLRCQPHVRLGPTAQARDTAELALTRLALDSPRPLLAICRGTQLLNVACGGSLLQHIEAVTPHRSPGGGDASSWHSVDVVAGTLLSRSVGDGPLWVNSRHHQAVTPGRLAPGLVAAGRADLEALIVLEATRGAGSAVCAWRPMAP
ncbi:MAG: gamma-glutamyl-gamma-aminobutyrate hydrolase family protein [Dehalococcoidia bacterium]